MTDAFNLVDLIREVCRSFDGELNTGKVAFETLNRISPAARDEALSQALPYVVREVIEKQRRGTAIRPENAVAAEVVTPIAAGHRMSRKAPVGRSAKVQALRAHGERWRAMLEVPFSVDRNGNSIPLGDLTRDQLLFNIRAREDQAAAISAKAAQLRGLLDLCERHEVERVRDLPEAVLSAILERAA